MASLSGVNRHSECPLGKVPHAVSSENWLKGTPRTAGPALDAFPTPSLSPPEYEGSESAAPLTAELASLVYSVFPLFLSEKNMFMLLYLFGGRGIHMSCDRICHGALIKVRGQLKGVSSLPCGPWGLSAGCQAWQQAPLSTEPYRQPFPIFFYIFH